MVFRISRILFLFKSLVVCLIIGPTHNIVITLVFSTVRCFPSVIAHFKAYTKEILEKMSIYFKSPKMIKRREGTHLLLTLNSHNVLIGFLSDFHQIVHVALDPCLSIAACSSYKKLLRGNLQPEIPCELKENSVQE